MSRIISAQEVLRHNNPGDVWIIVDSKVYDMTEFAPSHPGGSDSTYPHYISTSYLTKFQSYTDTLEVMLQVHTPKYMGRLLSDLPFLYPR